MIAAAMPSGRELYSSFYFCHVKQMRKEDELIISCARTVIPPSLRERVQGLVNNNPDWQYILPALHKHAVLPLVFQSLQSVCPDSLPETVREEMKNCSRNVIARNLYMSGMLLDILALFRNNNIEAVPFKGPVLAETVYGNLGLRSFGDLDILLRPHDAGRAIDLLCRQEFTPLIRLSPAQLTVYMKTEDDMVLLQHAKRLMVELHWEMTGRFLARPLDMALIHDRLETVKLLDTEVQSLAAEDLLVYLCVHGTRHMWERLEWLCGIAELIHSRKQLQWDMAFHLAGQMRCCRMLRHTLLLAQDLFKVELPEHVKDKLNADEQMSALTKGIKNNMFPLYRLQATGGGNRFKGLQFRIRDSLTDRVAYGWRQLTAPREADWRWLPLPAQLTFLYLFLRPLRLFLKQLRLKVN